MPVFEDAQRMQRKHPDTFAALAGDDMSGLVVGSFVKLCTGGERFWVEVTEIEHGGLRGRVNNDLVCTEAHGLNNGDSVEFQRRHIYSVYEAPERAP